MQLQIVARHIANIHLTKALGPDSPRIAQLGLGVLCAAIDDLEGLAEAWQRHGLPPEDECLDDYLEALTFAAEALERKVRCLRGQCQDDADIQAQFRAVEVRR